MNRVNITIDKALHAKAVKHAKQEHFTTFSGLVVKPILQDMSETKPSLGEVILPPVEAQPKKKRKTG